MVRALELGTMSLIAIVALAVGNASVFAIPKGRVMNLNPMDVRIYQDFTFPPDPGKVMTLSDMDVAYALSGRLLEWNDTKQLTAGLAERWERSSPGVYRLYLRKDAKWSDGEIFKASHFKRSLERNLKVYEQDLRLFSSLVERVECPNESTIDFYLSEKAVKSDLPARFTEVQFGALWIKDGDEIDTSKSAGPFYVDPKSSESELILVRNPHWYLPQKNTPNRVILRRSPRGSSRDTILLDDSWPNVATSSSMMPTEVREEYRKMGFQFWERPADRVFLLKLGPRINDRSGRRLARFLNQKLRHKKLLGGLAGTVPTEQIFPLGYHLYDPGFDLSKDQKTELPVDFRKKPISLLATDRRVSKKLLESAVEAIESVTGVRPVVKKTTLSNLIREFAAATYDLYFGPIGLADPDPNGVLSFYLEGEQPIIMSNPKAGFDYLKILDKIRTDQDEASRLQKMRKLVTQTIQDGSVVPLFHFSSLGIARPEIDLSDIPTSDESLTFSRILISKEGRSRLSE